MSNTDFLNLLSYVRVYNILDADTCNKMISQTDLNDNYQPHLWTSNTTGKIDNIDSLEQNFCRAALDKENSAKAKTAVNTALNQYNFDNYLLTEIEEPWPITNVLDPVVNKYTAGSCMQAHCDHVQMNASNHRERPLLSIVGLLNDDFEGGKFNICNTFIKLCKGDVVIFPSNHLYRHYVETITKGTRYSFVTWAN